MRTIQKLLTGLLDITCCTSLYTSGLMVMAARNPPPPAPHKQDPDSDIIKRFLDALWMLTMKEMINHFDECIHNMRQGTCVKSHCTSLIENDVILPGAITSFCCCALFKHCPKAARSPVCKQWLCLSRRKICFKNARIKKGQWN